MGFGKYLNLVLQYVIVEFFIFNLDILSKIKHLLSK